MDDQSLEEELTMAEGRVTDSPLVTDIGRDQDHQDHAVRPLSTERRNSGAQRKSTVGGWTDEEDARLEEAVRQYNGKNWKMIATKLPCRTDVQCLHRWQKVLNPNLLKGAWTKEEDDLIVELVAEHGEKHWSLIAKTLPGRIGKQCRERWHNYLKPGIVRTPWTEQEDSILLEAHRVIGNKWAELTKQLPGRSENAIKNHWNCTLSKRVNGQNNGRRRRASEPSNPGDIDYLSSFAMMNHNHNVRIVIRDPTTESARRDYLRERAKVANPVEEMARVDSSSGLSLDFVAAAVIENSPSPSLSTPLHDTRLSLEVSCPESLLRSAADSYQNFPSIIRRRDPRATDSSGRHSKRVATSGIMLFGKSLNPEFDAAAAAAAAAAADEDEDEVALRL